MYTYENDSKKFAVIFMMKIEEAIFSSYGFITYKIKLLSSILEERLNSKFRQKSLDGCEENGL